MTHRGVGRNVDPALLLFAFTAGAIGFFAPCCIAMLPAYVGYAVRTQDAGTAPARRAELGRTLFLGGLIPIGLGAIPLLMIGLGSILPFPYEWMTLLPDDDLSLGILVLGSLTTATGTILMGRGLAAARGALFGTLATLGFLTVFLVIGLPIAFLARSLAPYLNWLAILVGILLVSMGVFVLAGQSLNVKLPGLRADVTTPRGFYLFGLGYGIASLSCTFPVFLAVVAAGALSGGFLSALAMFATYALGKGTLLIAVTILTIAGGTSAGARIKRLTPIMTRASGVLLIVGGAYISYYFGRFAPGLGA